MNRIRKAKRTSRQNMSLTIDRDDDVSVIRRNSAINCDCTPREIQRRRSTRSLCKAEKHEDGHYAKIIPPMTHTWESDWKIVGSYWPARTLPGSRQWLDLYCQFEQLKRHWYYYAVRGFQRGKDNITHVDAPTWASKSIQSTSIGAPLILVRTTIWGPYDSPDAVPSSWRVKLPACALPLATVCPSTVMMYDP